MVTQASDTMRVSDRLEVFAVEENREEEVEVVSRTLNWENPTNAFYQTAYQACKAFYPGDTRPTETELDTTGGI